MKTKLLVFAICSFYMLNSNGQTFQKSINTNNQEHFHDLSNVLIEDGGNDFAVSGNIFDPTMQIYQPFLKRVDNLGNILWFNSYTSTLPNARFFDISYYKDTGISFIAITGSIDVAGTKRVFVATVQATTGVLVSQQFYDIISPTVNSTGLHISTTYTDVDGDSILDPGFIIGGFFTDSYNIDPNANNLGFVMRVYVTLGLFWTIELDSSSTNADYDFVNQITETNDGFFLTGSTNDVATSQQAVLAHKIDFQGNLLWNSSYVFGNSQDVSVDAYYDIATDQIYMLSNYSVAHFFGVSVFDNASGNMVGAQSWYATGNEFNRYGFTIMESLDSSNNLIVTGYDRDVNWTDGSNSYSGQSNLFVYEFEKATGDQVGIHNYQYLVTHVEPVGDEYNFWNAQMPLIYYPDISFKFFDLEGIPYYNHIGYKTNTSINFTEADMFKTYTDKINECDNLELNISHSSVIKVDVNVLSGLVPNSQNPLVLVDNPTAFTESDCSPTLSIENNEMEEGFMYPNPAFTTVNIYVVADSEYVIYDLNGRQVMQENKLLIGENTIVIHSLMSGVYFVKITSNGNSITKKLIKK